MSILVDEEMYIALGFQNLKLVYLSLSEVMFDDVYSFIDFGYTYVE